MIQAVTDPFKHVYFIEQGVASVLTTMANGATIEVGMIGMEGLVVPACDGGKNLVCFPENLKDASSVTIRNVDKLPK